jgi:predicted phage tail protein
MRKIYLHGHLADEFGAEFTFDVQTAAEAVRALCVNFKDFEAAMRNGEFHVVRGDDIDTGYDLDLDECSTYRLGTKPVHIVPVIAGSKQGGLLKVILGVALIGVSLGAGLLAGGLATPIFAGVTYGNMAILGVALVAGGISQMLSPEKKNDEKKEDSYAFSGPGNAYEQGNPIPLVYGEVITGGVLISVGLDIEQLGN